MSEKRRRRVSKLIVRIKPLIKEDRKKARVMEEMINCQLNKIRSEIEEWIQGKLRESILWGKNEHI